MESESAQSKQINVAIEERNKDIIQLFDIIKWSSPGKGITNVKTGIVIAFVPAGALPEDCKKNILKLINFEELPEMAQFAEPRYRTTKVPRPTFIAWGFFKDPIGRKHQGLFRPTASRVTLIKGSTKSIVELYNEA